MRKGGFSLLSQRRRKGLENHGRAKAVAGGEREESDSEKRKGKECQFRLAIAENEKGERCFTGEEWKTPCFFIHARIRQHVLRLMKRGLVLSNILKGSWEDSRPHRLGLLLFSISPAEVTELDTSNFCIWLK
ncbi:hypothetical protein NE237_012058 [Protea cynaroides]|uniref:Uncharacterized protein n=1 Tax=Protea cynaroides TaxID=273540 RepID=A0A9Q0GXC5_9MAGN|nr:hypothetical protein NE237_012058 [Protea cynaroides]